MSLTERSLDDLLLEVIMEEWSGDYQVVLRSATKRWIRDMLSMKTEDSIGKIVERIKNRIHNEVWLEKLSKKKAIMTQLAGVTYTGVSRVQSAEIMRLIDNNEMSHREAGIFLEEMGNVNKEKWRKSLYQIEHEIGKEKSEELAKRGRSEIEETGGQVTTLVIIEALIGSKKTEKEVEFELMLDIMCQHAVVTIERLGIGLKNTKNKTSQSSYKVERSAKIKPIGTDFSIS